MDRLPSSLSNTVPRFPHPRGDGPNYFRRICIFIPISPPAWGWTELMTTIPDLRRDFPTRVGMDREIMASAICAARFPHPRGDGPGSRNKYADSAKISPPAWGWTEYFGDNMDHFADFPTRVGMDRWSFQEFPPTGGFPHPRGDGPVAVVRLCQYEAISPPAWGWTGTTTTNTAAATDFPTRVGMDRRSISTRSLRFRFPHPRGDGPRRVASGSMSKEISPPAWGWTGSGNCP